MSYSSSFSASNAERFYNESSSSDGFEGEVPICKCQQRCILQTAWTLHNGDRRFYGCPNYKLCKFKAFKWVDPDFPQQAKLAIKQILLDRKSLKFDLDKLKKEAKDSAWERYEVAEYEEKIELLRKIEGLKDREEELRVREQEINIREEKATVRFSIYFYVLCAFVVGFIFGFFC